MKVLLVDNHQIFAESLKIVLEQNSEDIEICTIDSIEGQFASLYTSFCPDIILITIHTPSAKKIGAIKKLVKTYEDCKFILLLTFESETFINEMLQIKVRGYLLKDITPQVLVSAIKAVYHGIFIISPQLTRNFYNKDAFHRSRIEALYRRSGESFTKNEYAILNLIAAGYDNGEISKKLYLTNQTVRNYTSTIYSKLHVHSRAEAIRKTRDLLPTLQETELNAI